MSQYFPPYRSSREHIKVKLHLSNYATKTDLKNVTNLADLKSEIDKINTNKLKAVPDDLAKLSNVVKDDVVKKTEYFSLKTKVHNIDTNVLLPKSTFNTKITEIEDKITTIDNKIPDITDLATKSGITSLLPVFFIFLVTSNFNSKITEIENKITTVDNKIPSISG